MNPVAPRTRISGRALDSGGVAPGPSRWPRAACHWHPESAGPSGAGHHPADLHTGTYHVPTQLGRESRIDGVARIRVKRLQRASDALAVGAAPDGPNLRMDHLAESTTGLALEGLRLGDRHVIAVEIHPGRGMMVQKVGVAFEVDRGGGQASSDVDRVLGEPRREGEAQRHADGPGTGLHAPSAEEPRPAGQVQGIRRLDPEDLGRADQIEHVGHRM